MYKTPKNQNHVMTQENKRDGNTPNARYFHPNLKFEDSRDSLTAESKGTSPVKLCQLHKTKTQNQILHRSTKENSIRQIITNCDQLRNTYSNKQHFSQNKFLNNVTKLKQDISAHVIQQKIHQDRTIETANSI